MFRPNIFAIAPTPRRLSLLLEITNPSNRNFRKLFTTDELAGRDIVGISSENFVVNKIFLNVLLKKHSKSFEKKKLSTSAEIICRFFFNKTRFLSYHQTTTFSSCIIFCDNRLEWFICVSPCF